MVLDDLERTIEVFHRNGQHTVHFRKRRISVKWNHQIVATRRVKAVAPVLEDYSEDDEQAPDMETMTVGTAAEAKKAEPQQDNKKNEKDQKNDNKKTT